MQINIVTYRNKKKEITPVVLSLKMPSNWQEVTAIQFMAFAKALCSSDFFKTLLFHWSKLPIKIIGTLKRKHLIHFAENTQWVKEEISFEANHLPSFRITGTLTKWYGYGNGYMHLTLNEFGTADTYLSAYHLTNDITWLHKFIAVLYRPSNSKILFKAFFNKGDNRVPFNEHLIDDRAKIAAKLPPYIKKAIEYNFIAIRNTKTATHKHVFEKGEGKPDFLAWAKITCASAGPELGTLQQIPNIPINHFLFYSDNLIRSRKENESNDSGNPALKVMKQ